MHIKSWLMVELDLVISLRLRVIENSPGMLWTLSWSKSQLLDIWLICTDSQELFLAGLLTCSETVCYLSLSHKSRISHAWLKPGDQLPAKWRAGPQDKWSTPWTLLRTQLSLSIFHSAWTSRSSIICSQASATIIMLPSLLNSRQFVRSMEFTTGQSHLSPDQLASCTTLSLTLRVWHQSASRAHQLKKLSE